MAISLPRTGAASGASLAALAEKYGDLPSEYVDFLSAHDGVKPPSNVLEGTDYAVAVSNFLPASEIIDRANSIEGLSSHLLPFAEDDVGNFVCIGRADHRVYFWDHEVDSDKVVAKNFGEFLEKLEPFDLSSVKLKPGQVKRVWVNPDFKPKF
jgi:hypothetical protein